MGKLDLTDLSVASESFGTVLITLVAGRGQGPNIPCRSCMVKPHKDNTADILLGQRAAPDGSEYPLASSDTPVPIQNTDQLFFSSLQAAAKVHILWRF